MLLPTNLRYQQKAHFSIFLHKLCHVFHGLRNSLVNLGSGDLSGSDLLLEAVLEEEVARNAKSFFSQAQNQTKSE